MLSTKGTSSRRPSMGASEYGPPLQGCGELGKRLQGAPRGRRALGLPQSHLCAASGLGRLPGPFQAGPPFTLQGPPGSVLGQHLSPLLPSSLYAPALLPSCLPNPSTSQLGFPGPAALRPGSSSPFPHSLSLSLSARSGLAPICLLSGREGWKCRDFRLSQAPCVPFTS